MLHLEPGISFWPNSHSN